jgi:hypothetical protein
MTHQTESTGALGEALLARVDYEIQTLDLAEVVRVEYSSERRILRAFFRGTQSLETEPYDFPTTVAGGEDLLYYIREYATRRSTSAIAS